MASHSIEGATTFSALLGVYYRYCYALSVNNAKIRIWLEDATTKAQWQTHDMDIDEFAPEPRNIGDATPVQYLKWYAAVLDADLEESSGIDRKLFGDDDDSMVLVLQFQVQIDILRSKIRDQQEELERLRAIVEEKPALYICVQSSESDLKDQLLVWEQQVSTGFATNDSGSHVQILLPGVVSIVVSVRHYPKAQPTFELLKNGTCVQRDALKKNGCALPTLSFLQLTLPSQFQ